MIHITAHELKKKKKKKNLETISDNVTVPCDGMAHLPDTS